MARVFTDAAKETSSFPLLSAGLISAINSGTWNGFTPTRIRSDCLTASRLLVLTSTPHCVLSASARSAWPTVARIRSAANRFSFRNACSRMPPIFPAPRTATRTWGNCAGVCGASTAISAIVSLPFFLNIPASAALSAHGAACFSQGYSRWARIPVQSPESITSLGSAGIQVHRPPAALAPRVHLARLSGALAYWLSKASFRRKSLRVSAILSLRSVSGQLESQTR